MIYHSLVSLFVIIVCLYFAFFSLKINFKSQINRIFSALNLCIALCLLGITFFYLTNNQTSLHIFNRYFSLFWFLQHALLIHFFLILSKKYKRFWLPLIYIPAIFFSILQMSENVFINGFTVDRFRYFLLYSQNLVVFVIYLLYLCLSLIIDIVLLVNWRRETKLNKEKKQTFVLLFTILSVYGLGISSEIISSIFKIDLSSTAIIIMLAWAFGIWVSVMRYDLILFDSGIISNDISSRTFDMLIITDEKGAIIRINEKTEELIGYKENEIIGKPIDFIISEKEMEIIKNNILKFSSENISIKNYEVNYKSKNGLLTGVTISISTITDRFNDKVGFIIIGKDTRIAKQLIEEIKERRIAEENLLESENRYKTLLEILPDAVFIHSEGKIIYVNAIGLKLLGATKSDEIIGKPVMNFVHKDCYDIVKNRIINMEKLNKNVPSIEEKFIRIDNTSVDVEVSSKSFIYHTKPAILVVARDISERKRIEEKIFLATKLESLGVLAGGIAHDFNNILTAIIGNISVAKLSLKDNHDEIISLLDDAEKSGFRAKNLTTQLMTFSKGGQPLKRVINLKKSIIENTNFILRGSNVTPSFDIDENLMNIEADEEQLHQVFNNIIINARQSMSDGGNLIVTCKNVIFDDNLDTQSVKGKFITISFKDFGCGIAKENLSKIFDPYFTTKKAGNGLGLASSYSIIKNHSGFIDVESQPGEGTKFILYLPATDMSVDNNEVTTNSLKTIIKGKILVMDDEAIITTLLKKALTKYGYEVDIARDGEEAVELYEESIKKSNKYDLVILDLTIPGGMGGKETMRELKKIDSKVKSIISSGYSNESIINLVNEEGFITYITKPYRIDDLVNIINKSAE